MPWRTVKRMGAQSGSRVCKDDRSQETGLGITCSYRARDQSQPLGG